jgi:SAM-dependent methyltransferase
MDPKIFYNSRFREMGRDIASVGWKDNETQSLRFDVLTRGINLDEKIIFDFGCGLGDFYSYLKKQDLKKIEYVGYDISDEMIKDNNKHYNQSNCRFISGDLLTDSIATTHSYDIIIASGTFSLNTGRNLLDTQEYLKVLWSMTRESLCVNFLSKYVDFENEKNFHYSPEEMFRFARTLTNRVNIIHDYPLYEFTLQLFK